MKFLAALPLASVAMLFASEVPETPAVIAWALQGGALAVLAWMVWYLLGKHLPEERAARKEERNAFLEFLRQEREARDK